MLPSKGSLSMRPVEHSPLRRLAEYELKKCFADLEDTVRKDLAISLIRQWITNEGHAGIITPMDNCWFRLMRKGDRHDVGLTHEDGTWGDVLSNEWGLDEIEVLALLHRLNLCQSALHRFKDGRTICITIDAREQSVQCHIVKDPDRDRAEGHCQRRSRGSIRNGDPTRAA
jgi:hypothetical protein